MGAGIMIVSFNNGEPFVLSLIGDEKHRKKHGAIYDFPKGQVDKGETQWEAAVRETFEESGIRISKSDIVAGPVNDSYLTMWLAEVPWGTKVQIAVNPVTGKLEHEGYDWLPQQVAEQNCYPYLRSFVTWAFKHI